MVDLWGRLFSRSGVSASRPAPPPIPIAPPAVSGFPPRKLAAPAAPVDASSPDAAPAAESVAESAPPAPSSRELILARWLERNDDVEQAWALCRPGPAVGEIASRLAQVPKSFLDDRVQPTALAGYVLDIEPTTAVGRRVFAVTQAAREQVEPAPRTALAVTLWLLASVEEHGAYSVALDDQYVDRALAAMAFRLAAVVDPAEWIRDADRRDEAARTFLLWLGYLPAGEDTAAARGTLAMRDSLLQDAALAAALADHQHRLAVTQRLRDARAREASTRYTHE